MTSTRPPLVALDQLVSRGLIHDIPKQPEPHVFEVALGFLAAPGGVITTRAFIGGALARAGKRMLAAGGEPMAVRNALTLVRTTWHYAWRLGLADAEPDEIPTIAAGRPEPFIPTPEEMAARKAKVWEGWSEKDRLAMQREPEAQDVDRQGQKASPRGKKAKANAARGKASSRRPAKRAK